MIKLKVMIFMNLVVLKFGGSSLADNEKLKLAAQRVSNFLTLGKKIVVIVSAQGKTTDKLINEAKELSLDPNKRELDMLMSVGEQISCSKFSILLQEMGYKATSLLGWQAGVITDNQYTQARIKDVYPKRIWKELKKNQIVVIAGFQGIDFEENITTIGRDGSDTTAIYIAAALGQKECYIFKDVDGIYDKNPYEFPDAKKITHISYREMLKLAKNGANVLHDRCITIAEKYQIKIIVSSSFENKEGSIVEND